MNSFGYGDQDTGSKNDSDEFNEDAFLSSFGFGEPSRVESSQSMDNILWESDRPPTRSLGPSAEFPPSFVPGTFSLKVQVEDFASTPLKGAVVEATDLTDKGLVIARSRPTDKKGYTRIMCTENVQLKVRKTGYTTWSRPFDLYRNCNGEKAGCEALAVLNEKSKRHASTWW